MRYNKALWPIFMAYFLLANIARAGLTDEGLAAQAEHRQQQAEDREAKAKVRAEQIEIEGKTSPAPQVTLRPFSHPPAAPVGIHVQTEIVHTGCENSKDKDCMAKREKKIEEAMKKHEYTEANKLFTSEKTKKNVRDNVYPCLNSLQAINKLANAENCKEKQDCPVPNFFKLLENKQIVMSKKLADGRNRNYTFDQNGKILPEIVTKKGATVPGAYNMGILFDDLVEAFTSLKSSVEKDGFRCPPVDQINSITEGFDQCLKIDDKKIKGNLGFAKGMKEIFKDKLAICKISSGDGTTSDRIYGTSTPVISK